MEDRRAFLKRVTSVAAFGLVADWASAIPSYDKFGDILPQRQLIRNGEKVTSFSMGGYHQGVTENLKEAEAMIERAMELGVRFFDNARVYHSGRSEEYYGRFLTPKYRDQVFLMTKSHAKTGENARKHLDESLKAMKTDYLDLWQIHSINSIDDIDSRIKEGVLDVFLEAKEQEKTRYLGFTGHRNPKVHLYFLSRLEELGLELDTCQLPINVCDPSFESFQHQVLPVLLEKKYGIIAMKTMAGGSLMGDRIDTTPKDIKTEDIPDVVSQTRLTPSNLHQYVYSLPISSLCSGCESIDELEANVKVLKRMKKMSNEDMARLEEYAAPYAGITVENYKRVL